MRRVQRLTRLNGGLIIYLDTLSASAPALDGRVNGASMLYRSHHPLTNAFSVRSCRSRRAAQVGAAFPLAEFWPRPLGGEGKAPAYRDVKPRVFSGVSFGAPFQGLLSEGDVPPPCVYIPF